MDEEYYNWIHFEDLMQKPYHDYQQGEKVLLDNGYVGILEWYDHDHGVWIVSYASTTGQFSEDRMEPTENA
jgi:hypothetical protein